MKWVLDNTVMSNFGLIERVEWLQRLGGKNFLTTREAWGELKAGIEKNAIPNSDWAWLDVVALTKVEREKIDKLMPPLDLGEATCIVVAHQRGHGVLTDDRVGRRYARLMGAPLSGTLGILKLLADTKIITLQEADEALKQMIALGYYSPVDSLKQLC